VRVQRVAAVLTFVLLPARLFASFHDVSVKEIYGGSVANPNARYVVLQAWIGGQNFVAGHTLSFFDAAGTSTGSVTFPGNVSNGDDQMTMLIATPEAQTLFGVTPDLTMTASMLTPSGGKVCWEIWDCVAWGNFAGPFTDVGTPFNVAGGIPTGQAIRRRMDISGLPTNLDFTDDTNDCANDFRATAPYPINNAGQAPAPSTLIVDAPATATAGTPVSVIVTALTADGAVATMYRGTVHFTSDDIGAVLPADYAFIASDFGVHAFSVTFNSPGSRSVIVADAGASLMGSDLVVVHASTNTALVTSGSPSNPGQSVTFTATVTSATPGTITGNVSFRDGAVTVFTASISGSMATFMTSSLAAGSHTITAVYEGDTNFNPSTSNAVTQVVNSGPFGAPPGFSATATSPSSVTLQWLPVADATSYEVYRSTSLSGSFTLAATTGGTAALDGLTISANTTYLYKVRAVGASGPSGFSAIDIATTIAFTDLDLTGLPIKADHVMQLRTAVSAMRVAAELSPVTFTDPSLPGETVKAVHISELRSAADEARMAFGLLAISYADATIVPGVTTVKTDHVQQLRSATQ
jgi:Big-like domain-containing protein